MVALDTGGISRSAYGLDRSAIAFLAVVAAIQCVVYATYPASPVVAPPEGDWFGWWDQSQYLASANAFAQGDLSPDKHWYPPGYSLLGAPFTLLFPRHPFFLVNLVATLIFAGAFLAYFRPLVGVWGSAAAFLAGLLLPPVIWLPWPVIVPFWLQFAVPWNSVPVAAAFMAIILMMRSLRETPAATHDFALGACAGLIAITRPADVLPLLPACILYLWQRLVPERRWLNIVVGLAGAFAIVGPTIVLMIAMHGGLAAPYQDATNEIGLSAASIPYRALAILIDGSTFGVELSLFGVAPLLFLAVPLAVVWACLDRRHGLLPVATALAAIAAYLSYNDFSPLNIFRFFLVHYIVWTIPVLLAAGLAGLLTLVRTRRWVLVVTCGIVLPLLLASLKFDGVRVRAAQVSLHEESGDRVRYDISLTRPRSIDGVDFAGADTPGKSMLPIQKFDVRANGTALRLFKDYRAVPIRNGIRFIFTPPVTVENLQITLDDTISGKPLDARNVRLVDFRIGLKWPWETIPRAQVRVRGHVSG